MLALCIFPIGGVRERFPLCFLDHTFPLRATSDPRFVLIHSRGGRTRNNKRRETGGGGKSSISEAFTEGGSARNIWSSSASIRPNAQLSSERMRANRGWKNSGCCARKEITRGVRARGRRHIKRELWSSMDSLLVLLLVN